MGSLRAVSPPPQFPSSTRPLQPLLYVIAAPQAFLCSPAAAWSASDQSVPSSANSLTSGKGRIFPSVGAELVLSNIDDDDSFSVASDIGARSHDFSSNPNLQEAFSSDK